MKKIKMQRDESATTMEEESKCVYLLGSRKDVNRLYQAMDVFLLPSRYEGLPVVAIEAQVAGLPCILSDRITKEVKITEDVTFLNLEAGSIQWAETVLRKKSNQRIKENQIDKFDIKCQAKRWVNYYSELIGTIADHN